MSDKNSLLYGAVTSTEYPDDLANLFLRQFANNLYEQSSNLRKDPQSQETLVDFECNSGLYKALVNDVHSRFKDPAQVDKTVQATSALDKVAGIMKQNLGKMLDNRQVMFDIESKSGDIKDTASRFRSQSLKLERATKLKQM